MTHPHSSMGQAVTTFVGQNLLVNNMSNNFPEVRTK